MTATPLVSVILPVRNGARFIGEAVASVLAQDWTPLELLVVDAASTDGTREIVQALRDSRVRLVDQDGRGIAPAFNQGIAAAAGSFIAFISSDDRWLPGKLRLQVERMLARPELLYTLAHFRYFEQAGCPIPASFNRALLGRALVGRIMETLVARREAFDRIGLFDPAIRIANDVDWYARAKDAGAPMAILDDVLLEKRIHDANTSSQAEVNTPDLMEVLRRSIRRQRGGNA